MAIDNKKQPSKFINNNLEKDEKLVCVLMSTKGLFGDKDDIAITNKRIFALLEGGDSYSFNLDQIKNIEAIPEKGMFGRQKNYGVINIYGTYNNCIPFKSKEIDVDIKQIREMLQG